MSPNPDAAPMPRQFFIAALSALALASSTLATAGELSYSDVNPFDIELPTYAGRPEETVEKAKAALAGLRPTDDPQTITLIGQILTFLCTAHTELAEYEQAETACLEAVSTLEDNSQADPTAKAYRNLLALPQLARTYEAMGQFELALGILQGQLKRIEEIGFDNPKEVDVLTQIGNLELRLGRFRDAEASYLEAIATQANLPAHSDPPLILPHLNIVTLYRLEERFSKAEALAEEGLAKAETIRTRLTETHAKYGIKSHELDQSIRHVQILSLALGWVYYDQGRLEEASTIAQSVLDHFADEGDAAIGFLAYAQILLARIEDARHPRSPAAYSHLASAIAAPKEEIASAYFFQAIAQYEYARHLLLTGEEASAESSARESVETLTWLLRTDHHETARAAVILARALQRQAKYAEAVYEAQAALAAQRKTLPPYHSETGETLALLAELYEATGDRENLAAIETLRAEHLSAREKFEAEN